MKLTEMSIDEFDLTEEKLNYFESILTTNIILENLKPVTIESVKANRWYGNAYGILITEIGVSPNSAYLNMRINGYKSPLEYDGRLVLNIIDPETFNTIMTTYERNKALKKSLGIAD